MKGRAKGNDGEICLAEQELSSVADAFRHLLVLANGPNLC